jgi:C-3',4' desaturase CrtD
LLEGFVLASTGSFMEFDTIIVGGGIGGLTAGALLAAGGERVLLLEAHASTGGCAGFFDRFDRDEQGERRRYRFDVGATTISGVAPGGPLRALFDRLGGEPAMLKIDPGMICHLLDGTRVVRHGGRERWIAEALRAFGESGQRGFWEDLFAVNDRAWRLSSHNPGFPPRSLGDLFSLARPANITALPLLRYTWTPVLDLMRRHGLDGDRRFRSFIDEQLMITAQNDAARTPFLIGAMGLAYPEETWYPVGGMYALAAWLEGRIVAGGGEVRKKRLVTSIKREKGRWLLQTRRGESYAARRLVSNATIHDMARLMEGDAARYFAGLARDAGTGWGAFTLYCAVRDSVDELGTLYHQIHTEGIGDAGSIFVSLSHRDDRLRAPEGWRTLTVSTHLANPWLWEEGTKEYYELRKRLLGESILAAMERALPGFAGAERKFVLTGTPRTFRFYTHRLHGMVGGIPHSIDRNIALAKKYRTPFDDLYLVGDTIYPGQGTPAVVLGALNLVGEIAGRG